MPQKWNLQDIRPARPERKVESEQKESAPIGARKMSQDITPKNIERRRAPEERSYDQDLGTLDIVDGKNSKRKRTIIAVVLSVLVLVAAFTINLLMSGAEITVYPKFKDVSVQATFTGVKTPGAGELGFELLTLEETGERQVKASGSEKVTERAIGSLFIYNTDTKAMQRLIKNTRFENPDGLIFRIKESVEVPSATKDAKGALVPGVVTAEVFADGTGDQYNVPPSRFTVPGLKDSPQFATVYGESNVAMTGGFDGERYLLDENELETKKQELHLELRNILLERLNSERPSGFILYPQAVTFSFEALPSTSYGDSLATIKEKASLHVPLFKEADFAVYLAESTVAGYEDEPVHLTDASALMFEYTISTTTVSDISDYTSLEFMLKGSTRIVWDFDAEKLRTDLKGLSKTALPTVLSGYPSIDRAEGVVRPFWAQKFPENKDEITVTTILDSTDKDSKEE